MLVQKRKTVRILAIAALMFHPLFLVPAGAQGSVPATVAEAAKAYGFTESELQQIIRGAILSKGLTEKSDKELAGVVAVFVRKPVGEVAEFFLEGRTLKSDPSIRGLRVWKPGDSVENGFADPKLKAT